MDDVNDYKLDLRVSLTVTAYAAVWLSYNTFFTHIFMNMLWCKVHVLYINTMKGRLKYD